MTMSCPYGWADPHCCTLDCRPLPKPAPPEVPAPDEVSLALTRLEALVLLLPYYSREREMARDAEAALVRYVRGREGGR